MKDKNIEDKEQVIEDEVIDDEVVEDGVGAAGGDDNKEEPAGEDEIEKRKNVNEGSNNGKVFTQEEVNQIVKERLNRDRSKGEEETSDLQKELKDLKNSLKTEKITNALIKHNVRDDRIDDLIKLGDFEDEEIDSIDSKVKELVDKYKEWTVVEDDNGEEALDTLKGKGFKTKISTSGQDGTKTPEEKEVERVLKALRIK